MTGRSSEDAPPSLEEQLRVQARHCAEFGSPMYADLLSRCAVDVEAGGPVAALLASRADLPAQQVLPLRLLGGVHALVLQRQAPELALWYPSVGGEAVDPDARWRAFVGVVTERVDELQPWLDATVQTNEPGRSAALLGALRVAAARAPAMPLRVFELGASAGLNLRFDALPIGPGRLMGTPMPGEVAGPLAVAERLGADPSPIDPTTPEGRLRLTAYVWADDLRRFERLRGALEVASQVPATVLPLRAAEFVRQVRLRPGHLTVVWHSIVWQYLGIEERRAVTETLDRLAQVASDDAPFAYVSLEPEPEHIGRSMLRNDIRLRLAPAGVDTVLGVAPAHGVPVEWRPDLIA
ncbi:MAG: DUF2332 domain-containing protein [Actinomycetes bacterium]